MAQTAPCAKQTTWSTPELAARKEAAERGIWCSGGCLYQPDGTPLRVRGYRQYAEALQAQGRLAQTDQGWMLTEPPQAQPPAPIAPPQDVLDVAPQPPELEEGDLLPMAPTPPSNPRPRPAPSHPDTAAKSASMSPLKSPAATAAERALLATVSACAALPARAVPYVAQPAAMRAEPLSPFDEVDEREDTYPEFPPRPQAAPGTPPWVPPLPPPPRPCPPPLRLAKRPPLHGQDLVLVRLRKGGPKLAAYVDGPAGQEIDGDPVPVRLPKIKRTFPVARDLIQALSEKRAQKVQERLTTGLRQGMPPKRRTGPPRGRIVLTPPPDLPPLLQVFVGPRLMGAPLSKDPPAECAPFRDFVKKQICISCADENAPIVDPRDWQIRLTIDPHHEGPRGLGQRASDFYCVALCRLCHDHYESTNALPGRTREESLNLMRDAQAIYNAEFSEALLKICQPQGLIAEHEPPGEWACFFATLTAKRGEEAYVNC